MIKFFPVTQTFALEVKDFYQKDTWKNSQMHTALVKMS